MFPHSQSLSNQSFDVCSSQKRPDGFQFCSGRLSKSNWTFGGPAVISVHQELVRPLKHESMPGILNTFSWKLLKVFTFIRDYFLSNEIHLLKMKRPLAEKFAWIPSGCVTSADPRWPSPPSTQKLQSWAGLFLRCFPPRADVTETET